MRISRRQFARGLAGVACLAPGAAAPGSATAQPPVVVERRIVERRIYAPGSALPPREVLQRHGIHPVLAKREQDGTAYWISFASVEARVKAWDRFNVDEEWCALRDAGAVALQEVQVYPAGKIFEISL
jgi:hypothetical protein